MADSKVLTLRLEPKLTEQLDRLAEATQRSRSYLIAEAVREYVALNEWQVEEINKAVAAADRGEFASDEEVKKTFRKRSRRAG
jgi:RHH-type transcriptional regulator, rel operon repressor / antitoxin RelB